MLEDMGNKDSEPGRDQDSTRAGEQGDDDGGTLSEAGSSAQNPETALGGADSVPDTPDVDDSGEDGAPDINVPSDAAPPEDT
jgi:hypothetical protein